LISHFAGDFTQRSQNGVGISGPRQTDIIIPSTSPDGARTVSNALACCIFQGATRPHGGSDFFNSTVISGVSAATSGAMLQAAIANNINMIARVNALTLAARYRFDALYIGRSRCDPPQGSVCCVTESRGKFVADERRFPGLFPMPAWRLEQPGDSLYFWRSQQDSNLQPTE
jgi:hypothetical protein